MHFVKTLIKQFLSTLVISGTVVVVLSLPFMFMFLFIIGLAASISEPETIVTEDLQTNYLSGNKSSRNKILSIPIQGIILSERTPDDLGGLFGLPLNTYGYELKHQLTLAAKDSSIKAIVLQINSPGGTVIGSKTISDGLAYYQSQTRKPIYAHISGLGASGAYWVAASADKIYADTGSSIGSIGVISTSLLYFDNVTSLSGSLFSSGVTTENGIKLYSITAGRGKDLGNPFRPPTSEELAILQTGADNNYDDFVAWIASQRNLTPAFIRDSLGAHIYDHKSAVANRLIDAIAAKEDVYIQLATAAGLGKDYQIVTISPLSSSFSSLFSSLFAKAQIPQYSFCTASQVLAFHGDLSRLCL